MISSLRIFLVEDHPVIRGGVKMLLEREEHSVVGEADEPSEALAGIERTKPDLAIVDLTLGEHDGLDVLRELRHAPDAPRCLIFSMHCDPYYEERAFRAGAHGYVNKQASLDTLLSAIQDVMQGQPFTCNGHTADVLREWRLEGERGSWEGKLSPRETVVYGLLGEGFRTSEIAERMHVSPKTVESYYARLKEKLQVASTAELQRHAIRYNRI